MDVEWGPTNLVNESWFRDSDGLNNNKNNTLANVNSSRSHYDFHNIGTAEKTNEDDLSSNVKCPDNYQMTWKLRNCDNFPMLGVLQNQPEISGHRIPMDFSPYLLSVSPPKTSGFDYLGYSTKRTNGHIGLNPTSFHAGESYHPNSHTNRILDSNSNMNKKNGFLKPIIVKTEVTGDSDADCSYCESPCSPSRIAKKVSFADHKGLALAQVRLVKEGPDEPPHLNPSILSSLTEGANADVTCKPPIKLCFPQPASDYLTFRDKLKRNLVLLENVVLKDYTVEGTIKVKNITFEKRVFVRLSLDEWETFEDIDAIYVPGPGLSSSDCYDTFSFKIDIPPTFDVTKKIQFAVCFEENGHQHWDSNDGTNYCIVSENFDTSNLCSTGSTCNPRWLPDKGTEAWSEFSVCRDIDTSSPYY